MTEAELLFAARAAVLKWQPRLHLLDWEIEVAIGALDDDRENGRSSLAQVKMGYTIKRARITFPANFERRCDDDAYAYPPDAEARVETVVVHELLHVTEQPFHARISGEVENLVGADGAFGLELRTAYTYYRENWINAQTRVLIEADRLGGWSR